MDSGPDPDVKSLSEEVESLRRENARLKTHVICIEKERAAEREAQRLAGLAGSCSEPPLGFSDQICWMIGLLVLDIHACPVPTIPTGGNVEFVDEIHLSLAGASQP